jgi:multisubunit Na+/H+ antiporter MnhE subunit
MRVIIRTIALFVLWVLLVGTRDPLELAAGVIVCCVAFIGAQVTASQRLGDVAWPAGAGGRLARLPGSAARELVLLVRVLAGRLAGHRPDQGLRIWPLEVRGDDPRERALRALTAAAGSVTPNTVVLDADGDRGVVVAHHLSLSRATEPFA